MASEETGLEANGRGNETQETAPQDGIRAFNQYGQEVVVPREEWRTNVLPGILREVWEQPDQLYGLILSSLNDRFVAEVTEAASHLRDIDAIPARGTTIWAIVLIQSGRLDDAEQVLNGYLAEHGEDGAVLTNLAKVYAERGDLAKRDELLWHSLELEPNLDNALGWYAAIAQEAGGDPAARAALERARTVAGSWRPQTWLARAALADNNTTEALALYAEALARAPQPIPGDLLMQMSGDLGNRGQLQALVDLTGPHFVPQMHGLPVGNNLIKALADLGRLEEAASIKDSLQAMNHPDWKAALGFWDGELARRRVGATNAAGLPQANEIQIGMLRVDGPIWLPPGSPARPVFGVKAAGPSVTFLGGSAEAPNAPTQVELQMPDELGRMTRALPLFFAEQVEMRTAAQGRAMIPWAVGNPAAGQPGGFIVSGARWPDETALGAIADPANLSDYVVTVHVDAEVEPWEASLVFVRASDGAHIGELQADFESGNPHEGLLGLADEVVELLAALGAADEPDAYDVPEAGEFSSYLLRLEQLLAIRCTSMDGAGAQFLHGEREILDGNLALCLAEPESVPVRLLLVETMGALARVKPEMVETFAPAFETLQRNKPIPALDALMSAAQG